MIRARNMPPGRAGQTADKPANSVGILFVCTGNICRSPTAEGVLRARARAHGLEPHLAIDSAGTHGYHVGEPPDRRAIAHAARRDLDIAGLRAREVEAADFARFDYIVAMDRGHRAWLLARAPQIARPRVRLYLDFAPELGLSDVPDPFYGAARDFERVLDLAEAVSEKLLAQIRAAHFSP